VKNSNLRSQRIIDLRSASWLLVTVHHWLK
jgi:hypothetical protein